MIDVRVGYKTQSHPVFVRLMDKDSKWGFENGLKTVIPSCLLFSILGYPFILPDMIGGNVYDKRSLPDEELFIRWVELNAFLPAMQFSVSPWQYKSRQVNDICLKYIKIRKEVVTPILLKYAKISTVEHGSPIIRPIWWLNPTDDVALETGDEFLIGDEILVAPVTDCNCRERNIYFPGTSEWNWKDPKNNEIYKGSTWRYKYPVPLDEIPYFIAVFMA